MTLVSTSAFYERSNLQFTALRKQAEGLQAQIGTGRRLERSSDDPVAAARLRSLDRRAALASVDSANSDRAITSLTFADRAVGEMADMLIRVRELAGQGASSTLSDAQRSSIGDEIGSLRDGILNLANSRDAAGNALFGGKFSGIAYVLAGNVATYHGTSQAATVDLGDGQSVVEGLSGPELFDFSVNGAATNLFETLGNLSDALKTGGAAAVAASSDALGALDAGLDKLTTGQTLIGTRLAWIDTVSERRTQRSELEADEQFSLGGTDLAGTISKLQQTMTILEASQASFAKLASLSLFDILR